MSRQDTAHRQIAPRATARGLARRAYRTLVGPAVDVDPMRLWPGTATDELPRLRVLHVGDCGVRRMETSHDPKAPPGFPAVAAERLLQAGVGMEFFHYFAINYDYLPTIERLERVMKLSGDPDVILVQLGATYARRVVVKDTPRVMQFRYEVSRRAGRLVFPWYRVLRPWVQRVGRHDARYPGPAQLERTLTELQATWPSAEVVLMEIFPRSAIYPTSVPIVAQVDADARAVGERCGVTLLDFADVLGKDPAYRCVAGYNLNGRGSELVGEKLAGWLIEHRAAVAAAGALSR
jgi:hypothetical protein